MRIKILPDGRKKFLTRMDYTASIKQRRHIFKVLCETLFHTGEETCRHEQRSHKESECLFHLSILPFRERYRRGYETGGLSLIEI